MGTHDKGKENPWKIKAVERSELLKSLKKELSRQWARADKWRSKSLEQAAEIKSLTLQVNALSQNSPASTAHSLSKDVAIPGHKFNLSVMFLSVILYKYGLSFRGVSSVWAYLSFFFGVRFEQPSYGIVRVWVLKMGLFLLQNGGKSVSKSGDKWALIVDESYSLGKSSLLLVLAVPLSRLKKGHTVTMHDVQPVAIRSAETWKSDAIAVVLAEVAQKIEGTIEYVVSDRGPNLIGAYKLRTLPHVPDWAHYSANILEKCYGEQDDFKLFNTQMGVFKKKRKQSKYSQYSPPNLSVKIRFMNYIPFLEWANILLKNFKSVPIELVNELQFLQDISPFIAEMTDLFFTAKQIGVLLKTEGICSMTKTKVERIKEDLIKKYPDNPTICFFTKAIDEYFEVTMPIYSKYAQKEEKITPVFNTVIASSEIIESIFGKFKNRCLKDPKRGFSANALIIPLFCRDISPFDVFKAMVNISIKELEIWEEKNLTKKGYKSFRNLFNKQDKKRGNFKNAA